MKLHAFFPQDRILVGSEKYLRPFSSKPELQSPDSFLKAIGETPAGCFRPYLVAKCECLRVLAAVGNELAEVVPSKLFLNVTF